MARFTTPEPFTINVSDVVLADLRERLDRVRWPGEIPESVWDYGANLGYMKELVEYWRTQYDWRTQERQLNRWKHFRTTIDGQDLHFIHERGKGPKPFPLVVTHGWPGSISEFMEILGPLTDPAAHGGDPADAFDVIAPSLPGYGFSGPTTERKVNIIRIAGWFSVLMTEVLGYARYGAQGGDWGAMVTSRLGFADAQHVAGIHLNMVGSLPIRPIDRIVRCRAVLDERDGTMARRRNRLPRHSRHETADIGLWVERLAIGIVRMDCGKVPHLERLRRRSFALLYERPTAYQCNDLLDYPND